MTDPSAPVADLDVTIPSDRDEWERRVINVAEQRLSEARQRLTEMGVVDAHGALVSPELPADMHAGSKTSVQTG